MALEVTMITQELMEAVTDERMSDIARLQLQHDARIASQGRSAAPASRPGLAWFRIPSFVAHILRPVTAR